MELVSITNFHTDFQQCILTLLTHSKLVFFVLFLQFYRLGRPFSLIIRAVLLNWMTVFCFFFFWSYHFITYSPRLFLIEGRLLYNVVLVSAIQQWKSGIITYLLPPPWASLPIPNPLFYIITEHQLGSLFYIATSHQLSILHMMVYICWDELRTCYIEWSKSEREKQI